VDGKIVGHVAFSIVMIDGKDQGWYGLGPISILPDMQMQGIGSALIHEGLTRLQAMGAKGCVLEGSPKYYQRFGFKPYPGLIYEFAPTPEYFIAHPFHEEIPVGKIEYHKTFYVRA
jgi:putative acetyltransferase